jgi:hypothetical protein
MIYCSMFALSFVPTVVLWVVFVGRSRQRVQVALLSALGTCVSLAIFYSVSLVTAKPAVIRIPGQPSLYFDVIELGLLALGAALGTILFGGTLLIEEFFRTDAAARSD